MIKHPLVPNSILPKFLIYANAYIQQGIVIYFEEVPEGFHQNKYIAIWSADEDGCFLEGHKGT